MLNIHSRIRHAKLLKAGFNLSEIEFFGLLDKPEQEISNYISTRFFRSVVLPRLNSKQMQILSDKLVTQYFLSSLGLPMSKLIGVWHDSLGMTTDGRPMQTISQFADAIDEVLSDAQELDLFIKPRAGRLSRNAFSITARKSANTVEIIRQDKQVQTLEQFARALPNDDFSHFESVDQGWLVQERVCQHPALAKLNNSSLNTFRIVTYLAPSSELQKDRKAVELDFSFLRVGRSGQPTDGWNESGGLAIDVDIQNGRLKHGRFSTAHGGKTVDTHPDSEICFLDMKIPFWEEAIQLCVKAATALPGVRTIGWDIAISKTGPILVEGNATWGIVAEQGHGSGYLNARRREMFERFGIPAPPEMLPSLTSALAKSMLGRR